ncbi:MAG: hypothetical protein ACRC92_26465 [Peptostreptococcaceae bacterium]
MRFIKRCMVDVFTELNVTKSNKLWWYDAEYDKYRDFDNYMIVNSRRNTLDKICEMECSVVENGTDITAYLVYEFKSGPAVTQKMLYGGSDVGKCYMNKQIGPTKFLFNYTHGVEIISNESFTSIMTNIYHNVGYIANHEIYPPLYMYNAPHQCNQMNITIKQLISLIAKDEVVKSDVDTESKEVLDVLKGGW